MEDLMDDDDDYDASDRMENDLIDRKERRHLELVEKRRIKRENRSMRIAVRNASKLHRTVRQLMKELPKAAEEKQVADEKQDVAAKEQQQASTPPEDRLEQLQCIEKTLGDAVQKVVADSAADSSWEDVEVDEPTAPTSDQTVEPPPQPSNGLERFVNWLWK